MDAASTTDDVLEDIDLTGRRVLVTGGASGLGRETRRHGVARYALDPCTAGRLWEVSAALLGR
jgi:hypothetical protein